ncbi:MAG: DUF6538 domain-containing protein, partial [Pararhodobacter sp.]
MPAAPVKLKYMIRDGEGRFRYNRTVPPDLREAFGRKMWNLSLGRDSTEAVRKCIKFTEEIDALFV